VLAITGSTFHDLGGTHFMQSVDTLALMRDVSIYNIAVTGPIHAAIVGNLACRSALGERGVAHFTIAKDIQATRQFHLWLRIGTDRLRGIRESLRGRWV
jgi:pyruvate dehydrogenase (quinone)